MSVETIRNNREFEQKLPTEIERKFVPIFPERLQDLRESSCPIEQYYLSHLDEPFSLRMREVATDTGLTYEATLKDTGFTDTDGVHRMEITAPISSELYAYYRDQTVPLIRKLRAEPLPGVVIDFYDDGSVQVESEDAYNWQKFTEKYGANFVDVSSDHTSSNEWRAHFTFRRLHDGNEALVPNSELRSDDIVRDILARSSSDTRPLIVHIGGRSGSGKTTIVREVCVALTQHNLRTEVLSTDDYHRGTSWLRAHNDGQDWTHWDDPIVYDTQTMAKDLALLSAGTPIARREIDWSIAEPRTAGTVTTPDVLLIEGIYANSADISSVNDLSYEMSTPLATCIGRRLLRDLRERPEFADPVISLGYMLREAEPAYRAQCVDK